MRVLHSKGLVSLRGTTVKSDGQPSVQDPWVSVPVLPLALNCAQLHPITSINNPLVNAT